MVPVRRHSARLLRTALITGVLAFAVSSCTTNDTGLQLAMTGNVMSAAPTVPGMMAEVAASHANTGATPAASVPASTTEAPAENAGGTSPAPADATSPSAEAVQAATTADQSTGGNGDVLLPDEVAYVPTANPEGPFSAVMPALQTTGTTTDGAAAEQGTPSELPAVALIPEPNPVASGQVPVPVAVPADPAGTTPPQATAYAEANPATSPEKPRGFFASLFASRRNVVATASAQEQPRIVASADESDAKSLIETDTPPTKPVVDIKPDDEAPTAAPHHYTADALPGVRSGDSLFEITRKSGTGDNSDVDINEEDGAPIELASAAGMARLDPHGLLLQRDTVDTACLRPALLAVLKQIEQHYGRKLIVTSGYRSKVHNAAARGARNSLHMYCAAADVQLPGISKWELAAYARSMPGRGGVGTYCHTKSVHIDIGPERDWNWRCRRHRHRS